VLTAVLGWVLVFVAFGQFQPTLLDTLQAFLTLGDTDTPRDDDRDGDEVPVATASAVGRPHRRRDLPVPPGFELAQAAGQAIAPASPPPSRDPSPHVPDYRNGIGAHLRC
jgi:hypothetical protein